MNTTFAPTPGTTSSQPASVPVPGSGSGSATTANLPLPGVAGTTGDSALVVPLDAFAKRGGPDVAISTAAGLLRVHAVFDLDPATKEMTVSVVDEAGRLIRMIPAASVSRMIAAMAAYRGR